ncbi:MAG: hypothetical protein AABY95_04085 [Pseudomonadota bacterium]|mgnify:CR=1 FL=1
MAPVLFLIFNRPEHTARSFAAIRQVRPVRLYVAADGPRPNRADEAELCARTRAVATAVDWPCEVHTRFNDVNQGCRRAVSGALGWFFETEKDGIILEDDLVAHPSFFTFANEMLARYRDDERVFSINGSNYAYSPDWSESYGFSIFMNMHGWATWRRSYQLVDPEMTSWAQQRRGKIPWLYRMLRGSAPRSEWQKIVWAAYWHDRFSAMLDGSVDSWAYVWVYTGLLRRKLSVVPRAHMVRNIGWGPEATHTPNPLDPRADIAVAEMKFPLNHPTDVQTDPAYDIHAMNMWARYRDEYFRKRILKSFLFDLEPRIFPKLWQFARFIKLAFRETNAER